MLDFPRVREMLAGMCQTPMGGVLARAIVPSNEPQWVESELDCLGELLSLKERPGLSAVEDVGPVVARARQGAVLEGAELLRMRRASEGISACRRLLAKASERIPKVWHTARVMVAQDELARAIAESIDDQGQVMDSASARLKDIRSQLRQRRNALVDRLEGLATEHPDWFQDRPTVRRDRFVLPLRVDRRDRLPGVIHESSGSGQTLFVEPMESVGEQNRIAELKGEETEEVARVLRLLSNEVAVRADELDASLQAVGRVDFLVAKCRMAEALDCTRPVLSMDGRCVLISARHPLLVRRGVEVVPLVFELPEGCRVVLVSGPNAGGKTVALKTLGLLSLMAGCGMYVPAAEGTTLPLYDGVFADIGDEQSLEADLSSFTAHLARLRDLLDRAGPGALVLLDEVGSSTSPEEGAALAFALLEALRDRGVTTVATSHFSALKLLVQDEPGMANAAMGFSEGHPTYRMTVGLPGESSAFEIAEAAGLPAELVERARSRMGGDWLDLNEKLRALDEELEKARRTSRKAERELADAQGLRERYEQEIARLEKRAEEQEQRLLAERERLLFAKRREIENLVRRIKETGAKRESVVEAKRVVEAELERIAEEHPEETEDVPVPELSPGDTVESKTFHKRGELLELKDGSAAVRFGKVRMELPAADLEKVDAGPARVQETVPEQEPYVFDPRLNIVGMHYDEAEEAVLGFLDEASSSGATTVRILHGRGKGVLQRMVWERLRNDRRVKAFRFGEQAEGGSILTTVDFRGEDDQA